MTTLLATDEIHEIYEKSIELGLDQQRDVMLAGLNSAYVAALPTNPTPAGQLMLDLQRMNRDPEIVGGVTPLHHWLRTASVMNSHLPKQQRFFGDYAEKVAREAATQVGSANAAVAADTLPERVIFRNDLLPVAFLSNALRTARSVARLVVPQTQGGAPRRSTSGEPLNSYATGWLIGQRHLITNLHAIQARARGEPVPTDADLRRQVEGAVAEFDYDLVDDAPPKVRIAVLAHSDATLDYAVLGLPEASDRAPLPLRSESITIAKGEPFPVNIIQHPGAAPKHIAIRNNLVAAIRGRDLAYYADTAGGSSGAPVCDDVWRVIALHREATLRFGRLNFQGKDTAWVNVGTPIALIISDLQAKAPDLWSEIAPSLT